MKTVIFLGAGASKADGAPLQGEIFKEYFLSLDFQNSNYEMDYEVASFFDYIFGIDVYHGINRTTLFPTFEEILGILDLSLIRGESLKNFDGLNAASNSNRIGHLRLHLILLMAKAINLKINKDNKYHTLLIDNLISSHLIDDVAFISTNYDILIDNALSMHCSNRSIDYGIDFTKKKSKINLYKLHGSLNWLYCPACNKIKMTPHRKSVLDLINDISHAVCERCGELQIPIIIPPTYYKNMNNVFLNVIWYKAEQLLRDAEHIIFCGYSFPDADIHIKYLLKRIETNRKNKPLRITVINNFNKKNDKQKEEEEIRFKRFFCYGIDYKENSFEDFAQSPEMFIK